MGVDPSQAGMPAWQSIQFQIIALLFIFMVLLLFCVRRKLHITRERVFMGMVVISLASGLLDLASELGMSMPARISPELTDIFRRLYLISLAGVGLFVLLYTLAEVYKMSVLGTMGRRLYLLPFLISIPLFLKLPLSNRLDERMKGLPVYLVTGICFIYMGISVFYAVKKGDLIQKERRNVIFITPIILAFCGFLQVSNHHLRIMSLGVSMVLTYMYMVLESPDVYVDKNYNVFNSDAFYIYLDNGCRENKKVSVLYLSVNEFSNMKDIAGTIITSELMKKAVEYLKSYDSGKLFFLDTGNFALVFERDEYFFEYASRIKERFSKVWLIDETYDRSMVEFEIHVSIVAYGSVRMPQGVQASDIISILLYFASRMAAGKENYVCIDRRQIWEMEAVEHVNREIEGAVKERRVDVFYQPIFSVYENKCSEVEALIRVRDRRDIYFDNSLIMPAAERSGEITALGYEVFRKICAFARDNDLKKAGINRIAVNLSMVQCQQRLLAETFIEIMEEYGVSASLFRFEISEKTAEYMTQNLRRNMNRLLAQGSSFVIDDYGNRLIDPDRVTRISRDYIKLGENVIRRYFSGDKSKQSMRVLCRMLLQLKMIVAAVGVEDQKQYFELKNLGITHMQGNAFFRPMPGEQLLSTLESEKAVIPGREAQFERVL